jgi:hypothetical protein
MGGVPTPLSYLLVSSGVIIGVLLILVIYGNTLSIREDTELYVSKAEEHMMGDEQRALVAKMNNLKRLIIILAVLSGILLVITAAVWVWIGLST